MKIRISAILFLIFFSSFGQVPNFEDNDIPDDYSNQKLELFSEDKDFVIAYSTLSFWDGYSKSYKVLCLKNEQWSLWSYFGDVVHIEKKWWGWKKKQDEIKNGKFNLVKNITTDNAIEIMDKLEHYKLWDIHQDSLTQTHKNLQRVADAPTYTFDFITKEKRKQIRYVSGHYLSNKNFDNAKSDFYNWWIKMTE